MRVPKSSRPRTAGAGCFGPAVGPFGRLEAGGARGTDRSPRDTDGCLCGIYATFCSGHSAAQGGGDGPFAPLLLKLGRRFPLRAAPRNHNAGKSRATGPLPGQPGARPAPRRPQPTQRGGAGMAGPECSQSSPEGRRRLCNQRGGGWKGGTRRERLGASAAGRAGFQTARPGSPELSRRATWGPQPRQLLARSGAHQQRGILHLLLSHQFKRQPAERRLQISCHSQGGGHHKVQGRFSASRLHRF